MESFSTIAEVGVALAGFSGLFLAFSRGKSTTFSQVERMAVIYLLCSSLGATVIALLTGVLSPLGAVELALLNLATGVVIAALAVWVHRLARRQSIRPRYPWVRWLLEPIAWVTAVLQLVALFGLGPASTFLALGLWWLIVAASAQFIVQVVATLDHPGDGAS